MRTYRAKSGPFAEQPFYKLDEIESICMEALTNVELFPVSPAPVRIDRFIEKRFKVQPSYSALPTGILGFTRFGANGVEEIIVSQALDEEGTTAAERRLRTTLAHEGGHGLLHTHLFALGNRPDSLFAGELATDAPKIMSGMMPKPVETRAKNRHTAGGNSRQIRQWARFFFPGPLWKKRLKDHWKCGDSSVYRSSRLGTENLLSV